MACCLWVFFGPEDRELRDSVWEQNVQGMVLFVSGILNLVNLKEFFKWVIEVEKYANMVQGESEQKG